MREHVRQAAADTTQEIRRRMPMKVNAIDFETTASTVRAWQADPWAAAIAGFAALLIGFVTTVNLILICVFCGVMLLDTMTGSMVAYKQRTFTGAILMGGILGKLIRTCVVALAVLIDLGVAAGIPEANGLRGLTPLTKVVLGAMIYGEGMSVLDNVERSEGSLPGMSVLRKALTKWRDKDDSPPGGTP